MKTNVEKLPKSTIKLTVTIENDKVKESYDKILTKAAQVTEIVGFRKGTAPKEMVKDKVGVSTLYGDALNDLLQTYYPQALKENHISPVSNPKVDVKEFDIGKDLEFTATFAIRPEVKIKDYKKALKAYYDEKKKNAEKEQKPAEAKEDKQEKPQDEHEKHVHLGANEVIEVLLKQSEVEVADILIEEETDRMLARLMDQLKSINLTVEKYLAAQNKTAESLRKDYDLSSEKNIKAEFVLSQLILDEKIEVTDKEIDDMIGAVGDKALGEKMNSPMEKLYIKTILQKNKLIQKLVEETEGGKHE
jgi:FKBP-type peptidyl-prolyl cis-trans isomerase (trigger factor)